MNKDRVRDKMKGNPGFIPRVWVALGKGKNHNGTNDEFP